MGNFVVTPEMLIPLTDLPADDLKRLIEPDYTVIRTSGEHEAGWKISLAAHTYIKADGSVSKCGMGEHDGHATRSIPGTHNDYGFRIFVARNDRKHDDECASRRKCHVACPSCCGWRPCYPGRRNLWPTHLTTHEQKEEWWAWLDQIFSGLKSAQEIARAADIAEEAVKAAEGCYRIANEATLATKLEVDRLAEKLSSMCAGCRGTNVARCGPCDAVFEAYNTANKQYAAAEEKEASLKKKWCVEAAAAASRRASNEVRIWNEEEAARLAAASNVPAEGGAARAT